MTWMVFLIAVIPAIGVVVVAEKTHNKGAVIAAAIAAAGLGLLTGNPTYIGVDLLFVGIATFVSWNIASKPVYLTQEEMAVASEKARLVRIAEQEAAVKRDKAVAEFFRAALVLGAIALFFFWKFLQPSAPPANPANAAPPLQAQPVSTQPARAALKPKKTNKVNSAGSSQATQRSAKKTPAATKPPVEKCLEMPDEQAMVRCLERAQ